MQEILAGIYGWPWFSEPHGYNFNGHFFRHAHGNLCVDPSDQNLNELARQGVARILITNRNHSRAANKIRARSDWKGRPRSSPANTLRNKSRSSRSKRSSRSSPHLCPPPRRGGR